MPSEFTGVECGADYVVTLTSAGNEGPIHNNFIFGMPLDPEDPETPPGGSGDGVPRYWYIYPSGWINVWFYDDPFDDARYKEISVVVDLYRYTEEVIPSTVTIAVNWSGPDWSLIGNPVGADRVPPIEEEDDIPAYISRHTFYEEVDVILPAYGETGVRLTFDWTIPDYNPEWVSIDVMGVNFLIDGWADETYPELGIYHECIGVEDTCPWDLSGDNQVTPFDVGFIKARYGCDPDDLPYDPLCEQAMLSDDDQVTEFDVGFVKSNYGVCPGYGACCDPGGCTYTLPGDCTFTWLDDEYCSECP